MAAAKGNRYNEGSKWLGRPSKYDLKKIAQDLVEWSLIPSSMKFTQFAGPRFLNLQRFSEWEDKDDDFAEAYAIAKQNLDVNRFAALNAEALHPSTYNKSEGLYDPIVRKFDREEKTFESGLRKDIDNKTTQLNIRVSHDGLGSGLGISAEKIPDTVHHSA